MSPKPSKKARSARMIALAETLQQRFAERYEGTQRPVLWEHIAGATEDGFINVGYTDNYIRVACIHPRALTRIISPRRGWSGMMPTNSSYRLP